MQRAKLIGLILGASALGYLGATWERSAGATPTDPRFMVGVGGVAVHRFADVTPEMVTVCYVASGAVHEPAISCVKR